MIWTFNIRSKSLNEGQVRIVVDFSNGIDSFDKIFAPNSIDELKHLIQNQLNSCEQKQIFLADIPANLDLSFPIQPDPTPPTQVEKDKQNYLSLLEKWTVAKQDIDKGLLDKTNLSFVKLDSDLKAAYKPEYSGL